MNYEDKDLDGKLQEDLEILERLRQEGYTIIEPSVPTCTPQNKVGEVNKSFLNIFKEKIKEYKNINDFLGFHDYDITPEEESKLDPINQMNDAAKKLTKKYTQQDGSLEIFLIIAVSAISLGVILALILFR